MKKLTSIIFCLMLFCGVKAQENNDLLVVLHQETLNKLLNAIGEISGNAEYSVMYIKGHYTWQLNKTEIRLLKDSAYFSTDVTVKTGFDTYTDHINGKMSITYNQQTNQIAVRVADAIFELRVGVLGKQFKIKSVQIADYLSSPFMFEGPKTMSNEMTFIMPNGTEKKIMVKASACVLKIVEKQIVVASELYFKQKIFTK
jgi:hypothetical protein